MENHNEVMTIMGMLKTFISGEDRSLVFAGKIEVALDIFFPEDDEIQDFVTDFASYRPGGGEYLYDEKAMVDESILLLGILKSRYGAQYNSVDNQP